MSDLRHELSTFVERTSTDALAIVFRETLDAAPEDTGALRAMLDTTGPQMIGEFIATSEIFCNVDYAIWTDAGSIAHEIWATQGHGLLVWDGPDGTVFVRAKDGGPAVVHHPGSPGTQWFNSGHDGGEPMASRWEDALVQAAA